MTSDASTKANENPESDKNPEQLFTKGIIPSYLSSWGAVMTFVVSFRVITANMAPIMDCDEVYNYWEPLHFMQFQT